MPAKIRIQNLYYIFCYAWDHFPDGRAIEVGLTDCPDTLNLFAHVLVRGVRRLLRRGLDRGYLEIEDDLKSLRGRILLADTVRRNLLLKQQVACQFDELSHDILHNQIIKATIGQLAVADGITRELASELRDIYRHLPDVSRIRLDNQCFRRVQLSRSSSQYGLLMRVCELLRQLRLPTQDDSKTKFGDILSDELRMHAISEKFVRNFYRHELEGAVSVGGEVINWDLVAENPEHASFLPKMLTDVTLRFDQRTIVIDTKYYPQALSNYRGERIWSGHLYQLFSYLTNLERRSAIDRNAEGILLYPVAGSEVDMSFFGRGHRITVRTLNLDCPWPIIQKQLLALAGDLGSQVFA